MSQILKKSKAKKLKIHGCKNHNKGNYSKITVSTDKPIKPKHQILWKIKPNYRKEIWFFNWNVQARELDNFVDYLLYIN